MEVWATLVKSPASGPVSPIGGLSRRTGSEVLALHRQICIGSEGQVPHWS